MSISTFFEWYAIAWVVSNLLNVINCRINPQMNNQKDWILVMVLSPIWGVGFIIYSIGLFWLALMMTLGGRGES